MTASVVFLVDESDEMTRTVAHAAGAADKTKAESVATALNALLKRLRPYPQLNVALVGYRSNPEGEADVGCRWGGSLAGSKWVAVEQLDDAPIRVEKRTTRAPNGTEETRDFPIWYEPQLSGKGPQIAAFQFCRQLLEEGGEGHGPALVVHITSGASSDGNPHGAIKEIQELTAEGSPIVLQGHLATHVGKGAITPSLFPANRAFLPSGPTRDFFDRTSPLPDHFSSALRDSRVNLNARARGMVYNGKMLELSRLLSLVEVHAAKCVERFEPIEEFEPEAKLSPEEPSTEPAQDDPSEADVAAVVDSVARMESDVAADSAEVEPPDLPRADETAGMDVEESTEEAETAEELAEPTDSGQSAAEDIALADISVSPEAPPLVLFVIDRSVEDPFSGNMDNACAQLVNCAAEMVSNITKFGGGAIDTGVVTYGLDAADEVDVRSTLEGGLAGLTIVRDDQIDDENVLSVVETVEEVPNGAGGLNKIPHRYVQLVEVEAHRQAPASPAFGRVAEIVSQWHDNNSSSQMPPMVVHLTRGQAGDLVQATDHLRNALDPNKGVLVYHCVRTEDDHPSVKYPADTDQLASPELKQIWEQSSRLLGRNELAEDRDYLTADSRGMVVNAGFELLLHPIRICAGQLEL